jgi:hypothetical protein
LAADTSHHGRPGFPFTFAGARRVVAIRNWSIDESIKLVPQPERFKSVADGLRRLGPGLCALRLLLLVVGFKLPPNPLEMFQFLGTAESLANVSTIKSSID